VSNINGLLTPAVSQGLGPPREDSTLNDQRAMDRCVTKDQVESSRCGEVPPARRFPSRGSDYAAHGPSSQSGPRAGAARRSMREAGRRAARSQSQLASSPHATEPTLCLPSLGRRPTLTTLGMPLKGRPSVKVLEALKSVERGDESHQAEAPKRGQRVGFSIAGRGGGRSWTQLTYRRSRPSPAR
jgi:hypothetical protein